MRTLEELKVKNFKSICEQTLQLGRLNVFIGGNGSSKSNLIGVFHFLNRAAAGDLQNYTGEGGSESYFNASALSDGTLRFICLATLLLQPALPTVILLDEPELGRRGRHCRTGFHQCAWMYSLSCRITFTVSSW